MIPSFIYHSTRRHIGIPALKISSQGIVPQSVTGEKAAPGESNAARTSACQHALPYEVLVEAVIVREFWVEGGQKMLALT